jgi:hypothetical protein
MINARDSRLSSTTWLSWTRSSYAPQGALLDVLRQFAEPLASVPREA